MEGLLTLDFKETCVEELCVRLVGVPVRVRCRFSQNREFLREYLTDLDPLFTVEPTEADLERMLHRFFVPIRRTDPAYAVYAWEYPFFYRHKILLVLLPFYRIIRAMKAGRFVAEAKAIRKA